VYIYIYIYKPLCGTPICKVEGYPEGSYQGQIITPWVYLRWTMEWTDGMEYQLTKIAKTHYCGMAKL